MPRAAGQRKATCPGCGRPSLSLYIDTESGDILNDVCGVCDHVDSCGYKLPWWEFLKSKPRPKTSSGVTAVIPLLKSDPVFLPNNRIEELLSDYDRNNLYKGLVQIGVDPTLLKSVLKEYKVGTYWMPPGSALYWYSDFKGRTQTGKIISYDVETIKRRKDQNNSISWFHSRERLEIGRQLPCLFGEHLVCKYPGKVLAIVESEKTAIIGAIAVPTMLWIATGSKGQLTSERLMPLVGRDIILYPDLLAEEEWERKSAKMGFFRSHHVSSFLKTVANEDQRSHGLDIGDFMLDMIIRKQ